MKNGSFTGLPGPVVEDVAVQESMSPIVDRSKEYLCPSDVFIVRARRWLLEAAERVRTGGVANETAAELDYRTLRSYHGEGACGAPIWDNLPGDIGRDKVAAE